MKLEPLPRRQFLKLGLISGGAVAATLNGCGKIFEGAPESRALATRFGTLLVLSEDEAGVMHSFAETAIPSSAGFPTAIEAEVVQRLDEELYFISDYIVEDLKTVLNALEWMPIFYGYFSRFSKLSAEKRLRFLNGTKDTSSDTVRAVIHNCRMICFNLYYGHESTWAAIGYDGPFAGVPEIIGVQRKYYADRIGSSQREV